MWWISIIWSFLGVLRFWNNQWILMTDNNKLWKWEIRNCCNRTCLFVNFFLFHLLCFHSCILFVLTLIDLYDIPICLMLVYCNDCVVSDWMRVLLPVAMQRGVCIITNMGASKSTKWISMQLAKLLVHISCFCNLCYSEAFVSEYIKIVTFQFIYFFHYMTILFSREGKGSK